MQRTKAIIVGSGFAGLCMGIKLREMGITDFVILEKDSSLGGTWRDNFYPGAACDVESHLYSFSFEPNPNWSRTFSPQREILSYLEHCADKYLVKEKIDFKQEVVRAQFFEKEVEWEVTTQDGKQFRAPLFIFACGGLSRPSLPSIPGLESFAGKMFHSARWDASYSLEGKRVAVIGTGASAIQIVPAIAQTVEHLLLFQRSAPWILPKPNPIITEKQKTIFRYFPMLQKFKRLRQYLFHETMALGFLTRIKILTLGERLALSYLKRKVPDPELVKKLTPHFRMGCKRVLLSSDYYPALNRKNVALVTDPIEAITPQGIRTKNGSDYSIDAIILATGFQASEAVSPFQIVGREGANLNELWAHNAEAYLGTTIHGFPNAFVIVGPNTGLGHSSMVLMIESQVAYIKDAILKMNRENIRGIEVKKEIQDHYNQKIQARFPHTIWNSGCASWYQTQAGKNTTLWPGYTFEYRFKTRKINLRDYTQIKP